MKPKPSHDPLHQACFGLFQQKGLRTISNRQLQTPRAWHHLTGGCFPSCLTGKGSFADDFVSFAGDCC
jgi:hypothetical protein